MLLHSGFADSAYAYCDTCGMVAVLDGWSPKVPQAAGLHLHERITRSVEPFLQPCSCGGRFTATASPRCPACSEVMDPIAVTSFIEGNAPGTQMGWRWQQNWSGLYALLMKDHFVKDPWASELASDTPKPNER